jgi:replicative DNA helicase
MTEGIHYAKEIEMAILGYCLNDREGFGRIYGLVEEKHFYVMDAQKTFSVMSEMFSDCLPIDLLTVWERLVSKGSELKWASTYGNPEGNTSKDVNNFLINLTNAATFNTTHHLEYYCFLIKEMWKKRELEKLTRSGIDVTDNISKQGFSINEKINEILGGEVKQDWHSYEQLIFDLLKHQEAIKSGGKEITTSGFKAIDRLNGGFSEGQLIVIGARPSVGKSALANKIAFAVARKQKTVGVISLEMNNIEIAARLASLETSTSFQIVHRNLFRDEDESRIFYNQIAQSVSLPIYVSDKTKVDVNEIRAKAIKLKHRYGLSLLIVDYLQLIDTSTNKNYNREQEVAKISRGLKLIAMELNVPVVVLCQLNRAVTKRDYKNRLPVLSDLRESGAIEQDSDVVMMLHRDSMAGFEVDEQGNSTERTADLVCLKWRNGAPFHLELDFDPPLMKFSEKGSNLIPIKIQDDADYF